MEELKAKIADLEKSLEEAKAALEEALKSQKHYGNGYNFDYNFDQKNLRHGKNKDW